MDANDLTLSEALPLLSLDETWGLPGGKRIRRGLWGAAFAELVLLERIAPTPRLLRLRDATPTGKADLDVPLAIMPFFKYAHTPGGLLYDFQPPGPMRLNQLRASGQKELARVLQLRLTNPVDLVAQALVDAGILREGTRYVEGVLNCHWVTPLLIATAQPKQALREHLRAVVLHRVEATARDRALLGLLWACDLLDAVLTHDEQRLADHRLRDLRRGDIIAFAVRHRWADWHARAST